MYVTLKSFHSLIWEETEGPCERLEVPWSLSRLIGDE